MYRTIAATLLLAAAPGANAQDDVIVVTGDRAGEVREQSVLSLGVISGEEIADIAPQHPAELLNREAGVFINRGKIALNLPIDDIGQHYSEVVVAPQDIELARSLKPINERKNLGDTIMLFENQNPRDLEQLGTLHTPSLSNLFVAKFASNYQSPGT